MNIYRVMIELNIRKYIHYEQPKAQPEWSDSMDLCLPACKLRLLTKVSSIHFYNNLPITPIIMGPSELIEVAGAVGCKLLVFVLLVMITGPLAVGNISS